MHATLDDLIKAYEKLTKQDLASLRGYAARQIRGTSFAEPDDLIQETMARAVGGSRKWPLDVPFALFFRLAMRSVAEAEWSNPGHHLIAQMPDDFNIEERVGDTVAGSSVENRLMALERLRQAQEAVALARAAPGDDCDAQRVVDGVVWGDPPRETRAALGASERDFDAARQRASRRLREAAAIVMQRFERNEKPTAKSCDETASCSRASAPIAARRKLKR
ncbi:MAG: hypothetical protein VB131_02440 [Burkholderia gladioli]